MIRYALFGGTRLVFVQLLISVSIPSSNKLHFFQEMPIIDVRFPKIISIVKCLSSDMHKSDTAKFAISFVAHSMCTLHMRRCLVEYNLRVGVCVEIFNVMLIHTKKNVTVFTVAIVLCTVKYNILEYFTRYDNCHEFRKEFVKQKYWSEFVTVDSRLKLKKEHNLYIFVNQCFSDQIDLELKVRRQEQCEWHILTYTSQRKFEAHNQNTSFLQVETGVSSLIHSFIVLVKYVVCIQSFGFSISLEYIDLTCDCQQTSILAEHIPITYALPSATRCYIEPRRAV